MGWINKEIKGNITAQLIKSLFYVKGKGLKTNLEFKIIDKSGSVFGKKIEDLNYNDTWEEVTIDSSDITYWWGGTGNKTLRAVKAVEIAF